MIVHFICRDAIHISHIKAFQVSWCLRRSEHFDSWTIKRNAWVPKWTTQNSSTNKHWTKRCNLDKKKKKRFLFCSSLVIVTFKLLNYYCVCVIIVNGALAVRFAQGFMQTRTAIATKVRAPRGEWLVVSGTANLTKHKWWIGKKDPVHVHIFLI